MQAKDLKASSEQAEQETLFEWMRWMAPHEPALAAAIHIPNEGKRSRAAGAALKRAGLQPGAPDVFIPCPAGPYHGLFIEMKYGKNKPTGAQMRYLDNVATLGYKTAVCYSADRAIRVITEYLSLRKGKENDH